MYSIMNMIRAFQISVSTRRQKAGVYMPFFFLVSLSLFFVLDLFQVWFRKLVSFILKFRFFSFIVVHYTVV